MAETCMHCGLIADRHMGGIWCRGGKHEGHVFARTPPCMSEQKAKELVERAFGQAAPVEKQQAYPTSAAQMYEGLGVGSWTGGWLCNETSGSLSATLRSCICSDDERCSACISTRPPLTTDADWGERDPMERYVDGLTVRECLERFTAMQRGDGTAPVMTYKGVPIGIRNPLTPDQKDAARLAWSSELKRKQEQAKESNRVEVVCDDDRWEP